MKAKKKDKNISFQPSAFSLQPFVHVFQDQYHLPISTSSVIALVQDFIKYSKVSFDEVSIYFVETSEISQLHAQFFNDPTTTDCISFPMDDAEDEGYRVMGDVFVCPETATSYVKIHGGDSYQETTLYVVHGLLHLLGYDDIEDEDRQKMRDAESTYLARVEKKHLWITEEKAKV